MIETCLLPRRIGPQELVYQDPFQRLYRVVVEFDGFAKEYYVSDRGQRAALLVVRNNDEVLFVRQYRLLVNGIALEIPGGKVDEGENPEAAAIRECLEETGIQCSNLKQLISFHPSLEIWRNHTHIFYSNEFEVIATDDLNRRVWIPFVYCIEMIFSQKIVDSLSIIALLAYRMKSKQ